MISIFRSAILAASGSLAASIVLKATVVLMAALAVVRLARAGRAAVRHSLLAAAFAVLLLLPIGSSLIPAVRIVLAGPRQEQTLPRAVGLAQDGASAQTIFSAAAADAQGRISLAAGLLAVWAAGFALFLLPMAVGLWQVRRLRRTALPWPEADSTIDALAADAGMRHRVAVLLHDAVPGPMTCGISRPAIVLPADAPDWNAEDRQRAIVHELEHIRRWDRLTHCAARAVCAVYWFHPLVWMAWRRLALEAERACDDAVLRGSDAVEYADQLLGLARRMSSASRSPLPAMASRADLAARIHAVLDSGQRRGRAGRSAAAAACTALALVLALAPLEIVAAPQATVSSQVRFRSDTMLVVETVTVTDAKGKTVDGLGPDDFVVTEDGVPQKLALFELRTPTPAAATYYVLGYYSSNMRPGDTFRKVKVTCPKEPGAAIEQREGYFLRPVPSVRADLRGATQLAPGVTPPVLIYKKEAEYTEEARKAKYEGTAVLAVEIGTNGRVTTERVLRSLGLGLDEKALEAVRQWRFRPAMKDGKPIPAAAQVEVSFRLL